MMNVFDVIFKFKTFKIAAQEGINCLTQVQLNSIIRKFTPQKYKTYIHTIKNLPENK